jgi:hypothetical protein
MMPRRVGEPEVGALQYRSNLVSQASGWRGRATWPRKAPQNNPLQPTSALFMEAITFERLPALRAG